MTLQCTAYRSGQDFVIEGSDVVHNAIATDRRPGSCVN